MCIKKDSRSVAHNASGMAAGKLAHSNPMIVSIHFQSSQCYEIAELNTRIDI